MMIVLSMNRNKNNVGNVQCLCVLIRGKYKK